MTAVGHAEPKCPAGQRPSLRGCVGASTPARLQAPLPRKKLISPGAPEVRREVAVRALERSSRNLLYAELQRLEALLQRTAKNSPDRAQLLRRLAEGYVELERLATLESETAKIRAEREERAAATEPERPHTQATF